MYFYILNYIYIFAHAHARKLLPKQMAIFRRLIINQLQTFA